MTERENGDRFFLENISVPFFGRPIFDFKW